MMIMMIMEQYPGRLRVSAIGELYEGRRSQVHPESRAE